jgi:hypothetical protein
MIKYIQFEIKDPNPAPAGKWIGAFAIETNIGKRLRKVKDLSFRQWKIFLNNGEPEQSYVHWEFKRDLEITLFLDFNKIENCKEDSNIKLLYKLLFQSLEYVWVARGWDINTLQNIFSDIEKEGYKVSGIYGKDHISPDKKFKAQLYCELLPDYSDCYVRFLQKGRIYKSIKFLMGNLNPEMFYGYFTNCYWADNDNFIICDFYKEMFYLFNVNSETFSLEFRPNDHSLEQLQEKLKRFQK